MPLYYCAVSTYCYHNIIPSCHKAYFVRFNVREVKKFSPGSFYILGEKEALAGYCLNRYYLVPNIKKKKKRNQ